MVNAGQSEAAPEKGAATNLFSGARRGGQSRNCWAAAGEVDAIFLKGASAAQLAQQFGLHTVIDTGIHPEPLIRANNGTPRTLSVDAHLSTSISIPP